MKTVLTLLIFIVALNSNAFFNQSGTKIKEELSIEHYADANGLTITNDSHSGEHIKENGIDESTIVNTSTNQPHKKSLLIVWLTVFAGTLVIPFILYLFAKKSKITQIK